MMRIITIALIIVVISAILILLFGKPKPPSDIQTLKNENNKKEKETDVMLTKRY